jgi:hypothetical protein
MMEEEEAIRGSSVSVAERGGRMGMASATTTGMPGRRHLTNICIELGMSCSSSSVELQMGPQVQIKKKKKLLGYTRPMHMHMRLTYVHIRAIMHWHVVVPGWKTMSISVEQAEVRCCSLSCS